MGNILRSSKALSLVVILVLIAAIPLTVFIAQRQQDVRQRAVSIQPSNSPIDALTPYPLEKQEDHANISSLSSQKTVKVLVLKYFPLDDSGTKLNKLVSGNGDSLSYVRDWVDSQTEQALQKLTEGTKYHGYKNPYAKPALKYQVLDTKEFLKPTPRKHLPFGDWSSDYEKMLTEDVNICDFVDNKGVNDVWIWSYQLDSPPERQNGIFESNMSMGRVSQAFWQFGSFGDVSNDHTRSDNLPQCDKTYVVFNFNYHDYRGLGDMMHSYMHQIENELAFADREMFWDMYVGHQYGFLGPRRCGHSHAPPNSDREYDYSSGTYVQTDCENWQPVNCINWDINASCGGPRTKINCNNWRCTIEGYYVWWMQNIPGFNNNLTYQGKKLRNWWEFMGDFDEALLRGKLLTESSSSLTPTPSTSPTPTLAVRLPWDVNDDGCISILDFNEWLYAVKNNDTPRKPDYRPDINGDGAINIVDFNLWLIAIRSGQDLCP